MENTREPQEGQKKGSWKSYAYGFIAVVVVAVIAKFGFSGSKTPEPVKTSQNTASATETYKDGTYEAMGSYGSPAGDEQIDITLAVANGVITSATAVPQATNPKSVMMQKAFTDNFAPLVIGKKLSEISLDKVSRSSLTPKGFNDAVAQIQAKAKI